MKTAEIKHPLARTVLAIVLGMLVLMIASALLMTLSKSTHFLENFPGIEKTSTHSAMLILSVLLILLVNNGKLKNYGFTWNLNFPLVKIVIISLSIGCIASLIATVFIDTATVMPAANFTFLETVLYIWFWASICEEVLARGLVQGFLAPLKHIGLTLFNYHFSLPVIVGALFFGAIHLALLSMNIDIFIVLNIVFFAIILGLIAGYQKEKSNSLVPAIIVHFCFNVGGWLVTLIMQ